jgi:hypothetical protein
VSHADERTDVTILLVAFGNCFTKAPKMEEWKIFLVEEFFESFAQFFSLVWYPINVRYVDDVYPLRYVSDGTFFYNIWDTS